MASDTYPQRGKNYTPVDRYLGTYTVPTLGKYKIRKPHRTGEPSHAGTGIDQVTVLAKVERGKTFSKPPSTHQSDGAKILEPPRHRPWVSWFLGFFRCKRSHASRRTIFYNNYDFDYLILNFEFFIFFFYQRSANLCKDIRFGYLCA